MEFIKMGKQYLIKNSNRIIDEKEKLELEKEGLILEDITGNGCQEKTTKRIKNITKNNRQIKQPKL